jgi:SAM-dependent methyltransferase
LPSLAYARDRNPTARPVLAAIRRRVTAAGWVVRNFILDARYGGILAGTVRSRRRGAADVTNSPYSVLPHIFSGRIGPTDVLVDVGCGKGRVINWWLSRGLRNRIVGIEIEPDIAAAAARRLRSFPNVTIVNADATTAVPDDATLLYLYSPFDRATMRRLKSDLERRFASRGITALYWNPQFVDVFADDPRWATELIELADLGDPRIAGTHRRYAVVQLRPS